MSDSQLPSWAERQAELVRLAEHQLFFIGGAPRSGTTWLQQLLDSHPDISCRGEGLFWQLLARPFESLMAQRRNALETKNIALFSHTGGYPLPTADDTEFLLATAILLALRQQSAGQDFLAVGEKTPENIFHFPRLQRLFPGAKFIAIARDPRDVLTSAWHFFHKPAPGEDEVAAKIAFVQNALPSLAEGAREMIALHERCPADYRMVTYERLRQAPPSTLARLFRFLGVSDRNDVIENCLARTSFAAATGGRPVGVELNGSFFRKGAVRDWGSTLTSEMTELILRELGWTFPYFGWEA
jgi:Sulfotransferase family